VACWSQAGLPEDETVSDIDLSLARLAADAEQKRAALEVENEALRVKLADCQQLAKGEQSLLESLMELNAQAAAAEAERQVLEQERDMALHDRDRWHQRYLIATGQGDRQ
jgi:hypothetical protein